MYVTLRNKSKQETFHETSNRNIKLNGITIINHTYIIVKQGLNNNKCINNNHDSKRDTTQIAITLLIARLLSLTYNNRQLDCQ